MIFINVRQLIKNILKEETQQDLSSVIKVLLEKSIGRKYKKIICTFDVIPPWKAVTYSQEYQIMVSVVGGVGSKRWPQTQFVHKENDNIVDDVWKTVYNFMGLSTDVFIRNVKSCDEVMSEELSEQEQNESELTERCWKGYTQKGMKTMFGKRYPNCVKIKK
jgi:phosphoglucomutase